MNIDIQQILRDRSRNWSSPEPDIGGIKRRGTMLRRRRRAGISVVTLALVGASVWGLAVLQPDDSPVVNQRIDPSQRAVTGWETLSPKLSEISQADRAGTFAVLAAAEAGLIDPGGRTWDYLRVEGGEGEWTAVHEIINCITPGSTGEICPRSGEQVTATFVREDDRFVVREVSGAATAEESSRLVGTSLPMPGGPPRYEDVAVVSAPVADGAAFAGWLLWTGPIPADRDLHVLCNLEALDADGKVVRRFRPVEMPRPHGSDNPNNPTTGEASRDGNVPWGWGIDGEPVVHGDPNEYTAEHRCSTFWWTDGSRLGDLTSGGYRATDAQIGYTAPVFGAENPVALQIHHRFGWATEEFPGARECKWILLDESNKVLASEPVAYYSLSSKPRDNMVSFDVDRLPAAVELSCGPRRDDPTLAHDASIHSFRPGEGAVLVTWEVAWPHDPLGTSVCTLRFTTNSGESFEKRRVEQGGGSRTTSDHAFDVPDGIDPTDVTDAQVSCVPWTPGD
jgi:hypothetical protein